MAIQDWSSVAADNTSLGGISTDGTVTLVKQLDNMLRGMMAEVRDGIDSGYFINSPFESKATSYAAVAADRGKLLHFTAASTLSLTAAATLTAGWWILVRAIGGNVTVDPNGAELINGASTLLILSGDSCLIHCDGTGFHTAFDYSKAIGKRFLESGSVTAAATKDIDLTAYIAAGFTRFRLELQGFQPVTDAANLRFLTSTDSGATFFSTLYSYNAIAALNASVSCVGSDSTVSFSLNPGGQGNNTSEVANFNIDIVLGALFSYTFVGNYWNPSANNHVVTGSGQRNNAGTNAVRLAYSTGNIATGNYVLWGIRSTAA